MNNHRSDMQDFNPPPMFFKRPQIPVFVIERFPSDPAPVLIDPLKDRHRTRPLPYYCTNYAFPYGYAEPPGHRMNVMAQKLSRKMLLKLRNRPREKGSTSCKQ